MSSVEFIIIALVFFGAMLVAALLYKKRLGATFEAAQKESKQILDRARREADEVVKSALKEAKEESRRRRKTFEEEAKKRKAEMHKSEKKIRQREQTLNTKLSGLESKESKVKALEQKLINDEKNYLRMAAECELEVEKINKALQRVANMSVDEAKRELLSSLEEEARKESKKIVRKIEEEAQQEADKRAREVLSIAVQRLSSDYVNDSTVTVVSLPGEEMKGRIIGREGRNIRTLEFATGVDLIIDDTPEAVIVSCFNPVRREIAKLTLERLIADGRIHPARIEETAKRVESEFNNAVREHGEQAALDVGITDLHPELLNSLGRLKYRSLGSQSVLQHSVETAQIAGMMAAEIGLDVKKAKRAGLLHDIGKSADQDVEGNHAEISQSLCKRYGESADVIEAVASHHWSNTTNLSPLGAIVAAANGLSASRPNARREQLAKYIKRLEQMETLIKEFDSIEEAFVLQAGREVRALVTPDSTSDQDVRDLSSDIASRLRQELSFPGQVRITVVKESKVVKYAT